MHRPARDTLDEWEITGRARTHVLQSWQPRFAAQPAAAEAFMDMREAARRDGIDLLPCASWRPFEAQLRIWNRKFSGEAVLHDIDGLHAWLDIHIQRFGFFRPYRSYRGGMYPEPWHLSHQASARRAPAALDIDVLGTDPA